MKRILIEIFLITVLVIGITGCSGGRNQALSAGDENYRTGTQGLTVRFLPYSPPDRVFDNEELRARLEIQNKGATDILGSHNRIYLSGFDTSILTGIPTNGMEIPQLEGKKFYNPDGDLDTLDFVGFVRNLKARNIDVYNPVIMVTMCYAYQTIADPKICVDPDPFSTTINQKVCDWQVQPSVGSQGGPVAVDLVQVEAMTGKSRFKIQVHNVGNGKVLKDGADMLDKCNPYDPTGLEVNDLDFVHVDDVKLGDVSIVGTCKPLDNGYLRLRTSGSGFMICDVDGLTGPAYTTPLLVQLSYNYQSTISTSVKIIQTP